VRGFPAFLGVRFLKRQPVTLLALFSSLSLPAN
jgi:hypothetical protein